VGGYVGASPADTARSVLLAALAEAAVWDRPRYWTHGYRQRSRREPGTRHAVRELRPCLPARAPPSIHHRARRPMGRPVAHHPQANTGLDRQSPHALTRQPCATTHLPRGSQAGGPDNCAPFCATLVGRPGTGPVCRQLQPTMSHAWPHRAPFMHYSMSLLPH